MVEAFGAAVSELAAATRVWRPLFPGSETLLRESHDVIKMKAITKTVPGVRVGEVQAFVG